MLVALFLLGLAQVSESAFKQLIWPDNSYSNGKLDYNSLLVNPKTSSLYVGARGQLLKLWLYNLNDTSLSAQRSFVPNVDELDECIHTGASEQDCAIRVRSQFQKADGNILVCVSNAMKPVLHAIDGASLKDLEPPKGAVGICSPHQDLNTTAVYVEFGNPDDIPSIYSGIRTGLSLENHLIYRPPLVFNNKEQHPALRSVYTDSKWLNDPQFVASFSIHQYVYFFFREVAVETDYCGRQVYSRVARVCKNDLGGKNVLRQVWSSFVKARLNCSDSGPSPYYFNHLKSMTMVDTGSDMIFYGVFSSGENRLQSSAVCHFSLRSINQVFDSGVFLEQPSVNSVWLPTPLDRTPVYRPGSCVADSKSLSDSELHFAKSHMLLADAVPSDGPLHIFEGEGLQTILSDKKEHQVVLFIFNQKTNTMHKLLHWPDQQQFVLLASYELPSEYGAVNSLAILTGEYFYAATDKNVAQYRVGQCSGYAVCTSCAADPYCSWNVARSECFPRDTVHSTAVGWISDISNAHRCRAYIKTVAKRLFPGDGTLLECPATGSVEWNVDNVPVVDTLNVLRTLNGGLVILNATRQQSGTYQCLHENRVVIEYVVLIDDTECTQPKSIAQFHSIQREWCKKFEFYKSNISKWQKWYDENNECPRIPSQLQTPTQEGKLSAQ